MQRLLEDRQRIVGQRADAVAQFLREFGTTGRICTSDPEKLVTDLDVHIFLFFLAAPQWQRGTGRSGRRDIASSERVFDVKTAPDGGRRGGGVRRNAAPVAAHGTAEQLAARIHVHVGRQDPRERRSLFEDLRPERRELASSWMLGTSRTLPRALITAAGPATRDRACGLRRPRSRPSRDRRE